MENISTIGALVGLALTILLIVIKIHPVYAIILGALCGGLCGGYGLDATIQTMFTGARSMAASGLRILTSGVLVGALVQTRSTDKISIAIIKFFGEKRALTAIALASMLICAIGVFIPVAVITVAPIALDIRKRTNLSIRAILIALIGGGKAGNIISLNPNTIAVAESFDLDVIDLILKNVLPAFVALTVTLLLTAMISGKDRKAQAIGNGTKLMVGEKDAGAGKVRSNIRQTQGFGNNKKDKNNVSFENSERRLADVDENVEKLPGLLQAIAGPIVVIVLLMLKLIINVTIDTLIALPAAGLVTIIATGNFKKLGVSLKYGLSKVSDTFLLLLATGTIAGIISASSLTGDITALLNMANLPAYLLAPLSGMFLAAATASTTAGATISSQSFSAAILNAGVPAVTAGAMINASATIIDSMPHGSFFHASADAVGMNIKDRMKLLPMEALVGLSATVSGVVIYIILGP